MATEDGELRSRLSGLLREHALESCPTQEGGLAGSLDRWPALRLLIFGDVVSGDRGASSC